MMAETVFPEIERSVSGAMLIAQEPLKLALRLLDERDFSVQAHRVYFESMRALDAAGQVVDIVTLNEFLRKMKRLHLVGGPGGLNEIINHAQANAPIEYFVRRMKGGSGHR